LREQLGSLANKISLLDSTKRQELDDIKKKYLSTTA